MKIKKIIVLSLLCLLPFARTTTKELNELDTYIQFKIERDNIPGLALIILKNDQIVYQKGYGWADIENQISMTVQSNFCVASIAKSFTAFAVMQLHEKGKLNVEDPVNKYLPFQVVHPLYPEEKITISNGPSMWINFSEGDPKITLEEWARNYFIPGGKFYHNEGNFERWKPGDGFLYSNGGYGLLAYLVQAVSGLPFNLYCKQNIFTPLGMLNSSFHVSEIDTNTMASMYGFGDFTDLEKDLARKNVNVDSAISQNKTFPLMKYSSPELGAGALYTSANQLSQFLICLMNDGNIEWRSNSEEGNIR